MKTLINFLLLFVIVIIGTIKTKENFEIQNGICDCCDCGWISCKQCEYMKNQCCGDSMAFDRYTFINKSK